jgi:CHAT domain-containing protein
VVPDGALCLVNFGALPSAGSGYLVEEGPLIQYLSAERDLVQRPRRMKGRGLLALGDAGFDIPPELAPSDRGGMPPPRTSGPVNRSGPDDRSGAEGIRSGPQRRSLSRRAPRGPQPPCAEFRKTRFAPLPETAAEVEEIASSWGDSSDVRVLTGPRASESALKALAPGRRVLHLATHGFFLDASRCVGGTSGGRGIGAVSGGFPVGMPAPAPRESPLLVSGLALAGANLRLQAKPGQEDGVLMAQEVVSMDLSSVEWVVLSACDTGLGRVQAGEGVLGLRRSFEEAGVGAVIMSLWEVDDHSTRQWMQHLYESRFRLGRTTPEAVRDADLSVLRDRRAHGLGTHPFYWAGFVATGDWK